MKFLYLVCAIMLLSLCSGCGLFDCGCEGDMNGVKAKHGSPDRVSATVDDGCDITTYYYDDRNVAYVFTDCPESCCDVRKIRY